MKKEKPAAKAAITASSVTSVDTPAVTAAPPAEPQPHDNKAAVQRAGAAVLHALPELGQIATVAVQTGAVHLSPQAMAIAQLLQLLPMLHAAPPPAAPTS